MLYCRATFHRSMGLGNRLWPWARCRIFSEVNDARMLATPWYKVRVGPLVRPPYSVKKVRDLLYLRLFDGVPGQFGDLRSWAVQLRQPRLDEPAEFWRPLDAPGDGVVVFDEERERFHGMHGREDFLHREIRRMTRRDLLAPVDAVREVPIGIHVRRTDFRSAPAVAGTIAGAVRTPLSWFVESLRTLRALIGAPVRAYVVSDGERGELAELLAEPDVVYFSPGSAISDMLLLARSRALIASAGSSFSGWASFLGRMPTVHFPGQGLDWFRIPPVEGQYIGALLPDAPSPELERQLSTPHRPSPRRSAVAAGIH